MRLVSLVVAFSALVACNEPPTAGRPPPPPPAAGVAATLRVHAGDGTAPGSLRLAELSRLAIDASYTGVEPGAHPARIDVITPRGSLYTQYRGDLELDAGGHATWSNVLEVSGTPIDTFHQVGTWRFVLVVDDGAPLAFAELALVE